MRTLRTLLFLLAAVPAIAAASTIYYWTDENGVRHYSNTGAPENATDVEEAPEAPPRPEAAASEPEPADAPGDANAPETAEPAPAAPPASDLDLDNRKAKERRYEDARQSWNRKIDEEREQLQSQIEAIRQRAPSRYFTEGMREAQLKPLQEKLGLLNGDPEGYFGQKAPKPEDFGL